MNKRQKKKLFKKQHGMNPKDWEGQKNIAKIERFWQKFPLVETAFRQQVFLRNLTDQRRQGKRRKGSWKHEISGINGRRR